ncbi:hypothetical protein [Oleiphilus sp. HI0067]|nr:hypothetical protein [Oleiphilus sp. HI0067]
MMVSVASDPVDPPIDPEPSDPDPVDPPVDPEPDHPIITPPVNSGYECSNAKPIGEGLTKIAYQKSFKNGVTYQSCAETTFDENGEKVPAQPLYLLGARLSGEGISGGLCYDSISHAQKEFAIRSYDAFSCNNIKDLGERVHPNLGLNPSATLTRKLNDNIVYDLGIRYSDGDIPGGICFVSVENGFNWLAWAKNGQVLGELKYTNPDAPYAGENVRLSTN